MELNISSSRPSIKALNRALPGQTFDTVAAIRNSRSTLELQAAIKALTEDLRISAYGAFEVTSDGAANVLRVICGDAPADWRSQYLARRLFRIDPRVRFARNVSQPFFMSDLNSGEFSPVESEFLELAATFGMRESFVYPYRTYRDRAFAMVFLSGPSRPISDAVRTAMESVSAAYLHASLRLEVARFDIREPLMLNGRQVECLDFVRLGKSSSDIGKILNLSPRTIDAHIAAACEKLGVRTRVQAAAKALSQGILPYRKA